MAIFKNEKQLEPLVAEYFRRRGFRRQDRQVPFYDRRIDLMAINSVNTVVSVECKLDKWQKAFEQALIYQLCSDLVVVALPHGAIENVNRDKFEAQGIGLLSVSFDRIRMICKPGRSKVVRADYRGTYLKSLGRENAKA